MEQEKLLSEMFSAAKAEKIDGINTDQLLSVTGFTLCNKGMPGSWRHQVNLNIALRYHIDDGQTYIYIGSPATSW